MSDITGNESNNQKSYILPIIKKVITLPFAAALINYLLCFTNLRVC